MSKQVIKNQHYLRGIFNSIVGHHLLFEDVGTGLRRLLHFDDFAVCAAFTFLQ